MKKRDLKKIIKECVREVLDEEMNEGIGSKVKGIKKTLDRMMRGWDGKGRPKEIMDYIQSIPDDTLVKLAKEPGEKPTKGSPRDFQIRAIEREMKRRKLK